MKFEYDGKNEDRECVAFIDGDGDLRIKTDIGAVVLLLTRDLPFQNDGLWEPENASHKFYPGDKITITF